MTRHAVAPACALGVLWLAVAANAPAADHWADAAGSPGAGETSPSAIFNPFEDTGAASHTAPPDPLPPSADWALAAFTAVAGAVTIGALIRKLLD